MMVRNLRMNECGSRTGSIAGCQITQLVKHLTTDSGARVQSLGPFYKTTYGKVASLELYYTMNELKLF